MMNSAKVSNFHPMYLDFSSFDDSMEDYFYISYKLDSPLGEHTFLSITIYPTQFQFDRGVRVDRELHYHIAQLEHEDEDGYCYDQVNYAYKFTPEEFSVLQTALIRFLYIYNGTNNKEEAAEQLNSQMAALRQELEAA